MPTYDGICPICGRTYQYLLKSYSDKDPKCKEHDVVLNRKIPAPMLVGMNFQAHEVTRKNDDGSLTKVMINSRSQQRAFCREQKLYDPYEIPDQLEHDPETGRVKGSGKIEWV